MVVHVTRTLALLLLVSACSLGGRDASAASIAAPPVAYAKLAPRKLTHPSPIGTNLAAVADWSSEQPFADLFKQSREWISNTADTWDDNRKIDVDEHGEVKKLLPGQRARSLVMWGDAVVAGTYVVTWKGSGELDFWPQAAPATVDGDKAGSKATVVVDPQKGGLAVTIVRTDPKDPVRDIHVWPKGQEGKLFNRAFLDGLKGYSAIRFMDWMDTNQAKGTTWKERPVVEDVRWSTKGVPLEVMIDLANELDVDPWLTIPHTWDDDAVAHAAALVKERLEPGLAVWVEHSNEVWNGMFPQAEQAKRAGLSRKLARDPFEAQLRHHAMRSVEIFAAWEKVFAKEPKRLVRVMGGMAASPWATGVLLDVDGAAAHTDVLAVAPYFGAGLGDPETAKKIRTAGLDALLDALLDKGGLIDKDIDEVTARVREHKKIADKHDVRLVAYEGGQHLVGVGPAVDDEGLARLFIAANRDPRMKDLYLKALKGWRDAGGGLFVHYLDVALPSKFGSWGARERLDQPRASAPKYDALLTFSEGVPAWW
jgi:hypothetical protein